MALIEFVDVEKSYKSSSKVIDKINLKINEGELITILGPSGCGKTTLVKMVNKLIIPDAGVIKIKGKNINQWDTIELRRSIGYVIQQIGLFPHLTVEENIVYVLSLLKVNKNIRKNRAKELIQLVGLEEDYLSRYPRELSGGQRQRVGVARALAADPDIILMDEPFGAVDEIARTSLQDELIEIHKRLNKTILLVTHDIEEALKLGSKIILLNQGQIEQIGTREELIFNPASNFVREFFGLKGFKASLDEAAIGQIYDKVLKNKMDIDNIYMELEHMGMK